ncbi:hypothetical protein SLE2022_063650 [Rubroshorea leprosula]
MERWAFLTFNFNSGNVWNNLVQGLSSPNASLCDLVLVQIYCCVIDYGIARIWRYDFIKKSWINEKDSNSGNRMIFLDYKIGSGSPLVASELADKVSMLNDKCYEPLNGRTEIFNFDEMVKIYNTKLEQREMQIIWFDHRLVWRKSDLLPHS